MGAGDPGGWGGPGTGTRTGGGTSRSGGGSPSPCTYDPVSLAEAKSFAHGSLPTEKGKGAWELIACTPPDDRTRHPGPHPLDPDAHQGGVPCTSTGSPSGRRNPQGWCA